VSVTAAQLPGSAVGVELAEAGHATSRRGQAPDVRRFHSGAGRDSGGFGLGLSIATQSIEVMGGNLVLGSDHAPGVVARIELPSGQASRA
jgi:signal transduction histidine kinase